MAVRRPKRRAAPDDKFARVSATLRPPPVIARHKSSTIPSTATSAMIASTIRASGRNGPSLLALTEASLAAALPNGLFSSTTRQLSHPAKVTQAK